MVFGLSDKEERSKELFVSRNFKSHSGLDLTWKIEMDALSDAEWWTIKKMIMEITPPFKEVVGIPRGGVKLASLLDEHTTGEKTDPILIVDDVLTTGASIENFLTSKSFQLHL